MKMTAKFEAEGESFNACFEQLNSAFNAEFSASGGGQDGKGGATFIPSVSDDGVISWTNDKNLDNPKPVNIKGKDGKNGIDGKDGVSPVVAVDDIENGHRVTITDKIGAKTFDVMNGADGTGGGGDSNSPAIIDVVELPTENIQEDKFYRVLSGSLVSNQEPLNTFTVHCVESLPESGLPATNIDQTDGNVYYNLADGEAYGFVDDMLSAGLGVPGGWYPAATLIGALGFTYAGVITDITDDPSDGAFRLLLESVLWQYKDKWTSMKSVGWGGEGNCSETFNHPSNRATGFASHAEGIHSHAEGDASHAEGDASHAEGDASHAEGCISRAEGHSSHAEGYYSHAEGDHSHAEGDHSHAKGYASHVEGEGSAAEGACSHAEGHYSHAEGDHSHAEGHYSHAEGYASHSEGNSTISAGRSQHTQGEYNIIDPEYDVNDNTKRGKYSHIVGNGSSVENPSNAHTIDWDGLGWFSGGLKVGGEGQDDPKAEAILTESQVKALIKDAIGVIENGSY